MGSQYSNFVPDFQRLAYRRSPQRCHVKIRKQGADQHIITQTFTNYTTKHDSSLVLTVPTLTYDKDLSYHFIRNGLTWTLAFDHTGAFDVTTKITAKRGLTAYSFDLSSSETLSH